MIKTSVVKNIFAININILGRCLMNILDLIKFNDFI